LLSLSAARRAPKFLDIPERSDRDRFDVTLKIPDLLQALRVSPAIAAGGFLRKRESRFRTKSCCVIASPVRSDRAPR
jgi:hypothetical protein